MQLHTFAERVLHGGTLRDKLFDPGTLVDDAPGPPRSVPPVPARPSGLRLDDPRPKPPTPRPRDLGSDDARGRVLHAFANHELLALELMAAMLLRFPEAPRGWRLGLARTLRDEQQHLGLYLGRMEELGVTPGEVPVSSFFWDHLRDAPDPLAFTAAMGLGFEQANLDFALAWRDAFRAAGDEATATLLQRVYDDEVRHVRHGVRWFGELSGAPLDYARWEACLRFPMSPARARGSRFDEEGRRRAGMGEAYRQRLRVVGASRGRPPVVYRMDVGAEDAIAGRAEGRAARRIRDDLAHVPLLLTLTSDVVVAPPASTDLLGRLRAAGFQPGEVVPSVEALEGRAVARLEPWAWTPAATERFAAVAPQVMEGPVAHAPDARELFGKAWAVRFQPFSRVVRRLDDLEAALPDGPFVIKASLSASGTRRMRDRVDADRVARWIREDGAVVVQPWFDRVVDLSTHGHVDERGVHFDGVVRFDTSASGVFRGVRIGPWLDGLPGEIHRFAHDGGRRPGHVERQLAAAWERVALAAAERGYRGPLGVDAMIVREGVGLRCIDVVEVNPRWTMGRVGLRIRERLASRARGWWRLHRVADLGDPVAWVAARSLAHPLEFDGGRCIRGFVATADPARASVLLPCLELADRVVSDETENSTVGRG